MPDRWTQLQSELVRAVRDVFAGVAALKYEAGRVQGGWTKAVCNALRQRLDGGEHGIECFYQGDNKEDGGEFLFDFCALSYALESQNTDCYTQQALIAGEVEEHRGLGRDFEKLLLSDALVCFFLFDESIKEHTQIPDIDFYENLARKRRREVSDRGTTPPTAFIVACYSSGSSKLTERVIHLP
jgi:hypothetical protein